jgi:2-polyprenyl-6-methoxyphenol hydroxylase-like FAD-dependent oxidoreductase
MLEGLIPGLDAELAEMGAPLLDWTQDCRWFTVGGWKPRFPSGILSRPCSRDLLELTLRRRVTASPRVCLMEGHEALGLLADDTGTGVSGILFRTRHSGNDSSPGVLELNADLVVDATGRASRASEWLATVGYPRPEETTINAFLGYASRWYAPPDTPRFDWKLLGMLATPPTGKRGGIIQPIEDGRWIVTLAGAGRDYPPTDEAGFIAFARSLPQPDLYEAIREAAPLSPIKAFRRTENRLRHFERMARWPERFIVLGDAVCTLNPIYGQGMTVAALDAAVLDRCLRRTAGMGRSLARRFQRALVPAWTTPWLLATGEDFRHPTTEGGQPDLATRLMHRYIDRLQFAASKTPSAHRALIEVLNLLRPPVSLLEPSLALKALFASAGRTHT